MTPPRRPNNSLRHFRQTLAEEAFGDELLNACAESGCSECAVYLDIEDQRAPGRAPSPSPSPRTLRQPKA